MALCFDGNWLLWLPVLLVGGEVECWAVAFV